MAETIQLTLHGGSAALEPATRQTALESVAMFAARIEPQPAYWQEQFLIALNGAVRVPCLDAIRHGADPADAFAQGFGLRPCGTSETASTEGYPDVATAGRRLARLLIADKTVAVDLSSAVPCERRQANRDGGADFLALQQRLSEAVARLGIAARPAAYAMRCHHPDIEHFVDGNLDAAEAGPILVIKISDEFMEAVRDGELLLLRDRTTPRRRIREWTRDEPQQGEEWIYGRLRARELWRRWIKLWQRTGLVRVVLENRTESTSPLAGAERPDCVAPGLYHAVHAESGVLHLDVDLANLPCSNGGLDPVALRRQMRIAVRLADNLLEQVRWPLETIARDARAYRRVALNLCGIGELVKRLRLDPDQFETLREVERLVHQIKRLAYEASLALARERGAYPGLKTEELFSLVPQAALHADVHAGIDQYATRHHQLITIGPFAVLPLEGGSVKPRSYANLLPVLRLADSLSFGQPVTWRRLSVPELEYFMRLAWAYTRGAPRTTAVSGDSTSRQS